MIFLDGYKMEFYRCRGALLRFGPLRTGVGNDERKDQRTDFKI